MRPTRRWAVGQASAKCANDWKWPKRRLARVHPRYGYRRIWAFLRREGWRVNRKRVYRLWRREGFKVVQEQRKKRRLGCSAHGIVRHRPEFANHVWAWDFIYDRDANNRSLKWFGLIDEYTRECLALEVARLMTAADVIDVLSQVLLIRGVPKHIRSDNGPEFIAAKIRRSGRTEMGPLQATATKEFKSESKDD